MNHIRDRTFFSSWSCGKDSCLALWYAIKQGGMPRLLLTMLEENGERTRGHGLPVSLVLRQAVSLGIPLLAPSASWDDYESVFLSVIQRLRAQGIQAGVFGDIDLEEHLQWIERVCSSAGVYASLPIWGFERRDLIESFLEKGFKATIVALKDGILDKELLGRTLTREVVKEIEESGVDISGEGGEYHTLVTDGPLFSFPVKTRVKGEMFKDGYWFLDLSCS